MRTLLASLVLFLPRTGFARRALAAFLADWRYEAERASSFLDRCLVDIRWTLAAGSNITRLLWCAIVSLGHERSVVTPVEVSGMSSRSTVRLSQWCTSVREHKVLVLVCTLLATGATVAGTALQQERYSSAGMIGFRGPRVAATVAVPVDVQPPESRLERARNDILVRANLERIIQDLDLYAGERHRTPMEELIDRMRRDISLQLVDGPGELTRVHIGFTAGDPRQAQRVADRLAALFLDASSRDRRLMVESTDNYLESSIEELRVRIAEREQAIAESSSQSTGAPSQADTIEFQVLLDTYRQMLIDREAVRHAANLERRQIGEQFVLLDPARVPNRPEGPSRMAVGLVGSLVGLCLGVALAGVAGFRQRGSDELMT